MDIDFDPFKKDWTLVKVWHGILRLSIEPSVSHIIAVQVQCKGSQSGREPKHGDQIGLQGGIWICKGAKSVPPDT